MLKNNNKDIVKLIASRSMKSNRIRNIFATAAVILTSLMLTSVFTVMLSLGKNINTMQLRIQGTCASIFVKNPTEEQINKAKDIKYVRNVGISIDAGTVSDQTEEHKVSLCFYDNTQFEGNFKPAAGEITGSYPTEDNEIMLSTAFLEYIGIKDPKTGMSISVAVNDSENNTSKEVFILSGWYKSFSTFSGSSDALISEKYVNNHNLSAADNGIMSVSCKADKQTDVYDLLEKEVSKSGNEINAAFDVQSENGSTLFIITVMIILISSIIILSGYLLIYNVLYISVTKDIRFYGMLKTIGASPEQIKVIVMKQAFRFLIIGVPAGVLSGTLISFAAVPIATTMFGGGRGDNSILPSDITFNPLIYIGTIIFTVLTILLSCRKPAKIASSVSPVEALKYNGIKGGGNIHSSNITKGIQITGMALRNVFREKKRAVLVFASLFMGTMAFLSVNTFVGCMKIENYIDMYLPDDYSGSISFDEENAEECRNSILKTCDDLKKIDGMELIELNRNTSALLEFDEQLYKPFVDKLSHSGNLSDEDIQILLERIKNSEYPFETRVIGVSPRMIERYNKKAKNKIDIDDFKSGKTALIGETEKAGDGDSMIGKTITLTDSGTHKSTDVTIGSVISDENDQGIEGLNTNYTYGGAAPSYIIVCDDLIDKLTDSPSFDSVIADYDGDNIEAADTKVIELFRNNQYITSYDIKYTETKEFNSSMSSLSVLTSGISIVLILIGILNFINVMLTGVYTRRKELAVLESVCMTKKQILKMLMCEGLFYALITTFLILTAGNGIMYMVSFLAQKIADYAVFFYPYKLMMIIITFILAVCIIVPSIVYKAASKESITERIRDIE